MPAGGSSGAVLDEMIVRLIGDNNSYLRMLQQSERQTRETAVKMQKTPIKLVSDKTLKETEDSLKKHSDMHEKHGAHLSHRAIHRIGHTLASMPDVKSAEQALEHIGGASMMVGMSFGPMGMLGGIAFATLTAGAIKLHEHLTEDRKAATEMFVEIAKGSKTSAEAFGEMGNKVREEAINKTFNPGIVEGALRHLARGQGFTTEQIMASRSAKFMNDANKELAERIKLEKEFEKSKEGKEFKSEMGVGAAKIEVDKLREKATLQRMGIGLEEDEQEHLKILYKLIRSLDWTNPADRMKYLEVEEKLAKVAAENLFTATHKLVEKLGEEREALESAGESAEILKLRKRGLSDADAEGLAETQRQNEVLKETSALLKTLEEENENYGRSKAETAALKAEGTGDFETAENLRLAERKKLMNDLGKEARNFALAMGGATKADLAFAEAADPASAELAKWKTRFQETKRVVEEGRTPLEKYEDQHRNLSDLLQYGTLTQEQYNRAMIKAREAIEGANEPIKAFRAGSAAHIDALFNQVRMVTAVANVPKAVSKEELAGGAGGQQKRMADLLADIRQTLLDIKNEGGNALEPADVGE